MTKAIKEKKSLINFLPSKGDVCNQCGGNGYMKSAPNCYHTCLNCLGTGFLSQENN